MNYQYDFFSITDMVSCLRFREREREREREGWPIEAGAPTLTEVRRLEHSVRVFTRSCGREGLRLGLGSNDAIEDSGARRQREKEKRNGKRNG